MPLAWCPGARLRRAALHGLSSDQSCEEIVSENGCLSAFKVFVHWAPDNVDGLRAVHSVEDARTAACMLALTTQCEVIGPTSFCPGGPGAHPRQRRRCDSRGLESRAAPQQPSPFEWLCSVGSGYRSGIGGWEKVNIDTRNLPLKPPRQRSLHASNCHIHGAGPHRITRAHNVQALHATCAHHLETS